MPKNERKRFLAIDKFCRELVNQLTLCFLIFIYAIMMPRQWHCGYHETILAIHELCQFCIEFQSLLWGLIVGWVNHAVWVEEKVITTVKKSTLHNLYAYWLETVSTVLFSLKVSRCS